MEDEELEKLEEIVKENRPETSILRDVTIARNACRDLDDPEEAERCLSLLSDTKSELQDVFRRAKKRD